MVNPPKGGFREACEAQRWLLLKERLMVVIHQGGGVLRAGFHQDVLSMGLDGFKANEQFVSDILVRISKHDKAEHFDFADAQLMVVHHNRVAPLAVDDPGGRDDVSDSDIEIQVEGFPDMSQRPDQFMDALQEEFFRFCIPMVGAVDLDLLLFGPGAGEYVDAEPGRHGAAELDRNDSLRSKRQFAVRPCSTGNGAPPMGRYDTLFEQGHHSRVRELFRYCVDSKRLGTTAVQHR